MIHLTTYHRLAGLHSLIRRGRQGNATQLAKLLNQSERSVYRCLALLRELGAPLRFCFVDNRYYYTELWDLPWLPPPARDLTIC
jgi:predicted DNA-binding transcriptional regulator YafY